MLQTKLQESKLAERIPAQPNISSNSTMAAAIANQVANRITTGASQSAAGADGIPKEMEKQNKDYCQLCYKSFGVFTFRYHCRPCGRSCCADCSLQIKVKGASSLGMGGNYRVCEFCDIKTENPQLEEYYRLEC